MRLYPVIPTVGGDVRIRLRSCARLFLAAWVMSLPVHTRAHAQAEPPVTAPVGDVAASRLREDAHLYLNTLQFRLLTGNTDTAALRGAIVRARQALERGAPVDEALAPLSEGALLGTLPPDVLLLMAEAAPRCFDAMEHAVRILAFPEDGTPTPPFWTLSNEQGRAPIHAEAATVDEADGTVAGIFISAGASTGPGRCLVALPDPALTFPALPSGIRVRVKTSRPVDLALSIGTALGNMQIPIETEIGQGETGPDGWRTYDTRTTATDLRTTILRAFYAVRPWKIPGIAAMRVADHAVSISFLGFDLPRGDTLNLLADRYVTLYCPLSASELTAWQTRRPVTMHDLVRDNLVVHRDAAPEAGGTAPADPELQEQLEALGYLGTMTATGPVAEGINVVRHDPARAQDGYNFYVSGHEPVAFLSDMTGNVLHTWRLTPGEDWPTAWMPAEAVSGCFFRRAAFTPEGYLYAVITNEGLLKLDRNGTLLWYLPGQYHHDVHLNPDGTLTTMSRDVGLQPDVNPAVPIMEDFIEVVSADGEVLKRVSILAALTRSACAPILAERELQEDFLHPNTVYQFDGTEQGEHPAFKAGNVLTSFRHTRTIAILDMAAEEFVWCETGFWSGQHDPKPTPDGTILVFDNTGALTRPFNRRVSRVLEFDPLSREVVWSFSGTDAQPFFSRTCGAAERLPNGNVLITESNNGRAFEVTPDGDIVWEFINPARENRNGMTLLPQIYEMNRVPKSACAFLDAKT